MAKKNRSTLKRYFEKGNLPSQDQFGDLIDSALNRREEGFDRTPENGFEISLIGNYKRLVSFFKAGVPENAAWTIEYDLPKALQLAAITEVKQLVRHWYG